MTEAKRKQTAMYKIFAENEHGTDEVEFEIVVLGKYFMTYYKKYCFIIIYTNILLIGY